MIIIGWSYFWYPQNRDWLLMAIRIAHTGKNLSMTFWRSWRVSSPLFARVFSHNPDNAFIQKPKEWKRSVPPHLAGKDFCCWQLFFAKVSTEAVEHRTWKRCRKRLFFPTEQMVLTKRDLIARLTLQPAMPLSFRGKWSSGTVLKAHRRTQGLSCKCSNQKYSGRSPSGATRIMSVLRL